MIRREGYAREIAKFFETDINQIQKQLERLEADNVLQSKKIGKTRLFNLNLGYPFINELNTLLEKAFSLYPKEEKEKWNRFEQKPAEKTNLYESYNTDFVD